MVGYLARRLAQVGVTFAAFLLIVFFLVQAQPGDYTTFYILDPSIPPESKDAIARSLGLDQPSWKQFLIYAGNVFQGDLGVSFGHYPRTVTSVIGERLPRTALLFITATIISFYLGFVLGKIMAWRRGGFVDRAASLGGVYLYTVFTPWFALLMIWLFALKLGWLPAGKFITPERWIGVPVDSAFLFLRMLLTAAALSAFALVVLLAARTLPQRIRAPAIVAAVAAGTGITLATWWSSGLGGLAADILRHSILPVLTLTLISFAGTMLLTRNSMVQVLKEDYVLAAKARGLPDRMVRDRYAARNALLPVVTSFLFSLAFAIDGSVIIERIFSWPGMGLALVDASVAEDLPLAVGALLFTGVLTMTAHIAADVLYAYLDPRVRDQEP